jgi:hypothetical protein
VGRSRLRFLAFWQTKASGRCEVFTQKAKPTLYSSSSHHHIYTPIWFTLQKEPPHPDLLTSLALFPPLGNIER